MRKSLYIFQTSAGKYRPASNKHIQHGVIF